VQVAVLNNLRAGRSAAVVGRVLDFLRAYPHVDHVETSDSGALPDALAHLARRRVDLLIVNGGDGSVNHALTEILCHRVFDEPPLVAPLRGGRTNMTARNLGAARDPVKGLAGLLRAVEEGGVAERIVDRPVLRVTSNRRPGVHFGMFFGAGLIPRAIELVHRTFPAGRAQGVFGASVVTALLLARTALRPYARQTGILRPDKAQVVLDGQPVPYGEFMLLIASTLSRAFLGLNPFWGEGPGGVRFTGIGVAARRKRRAALGVMRGRPRAFVTPENGWTSRNVERGELAFDCGFTIDGELFAPEPGEVVTLAADRRVAFVRA
jgi:diacylglycerol kinase family enzyme